MRSLTIAAGFLALFAFASPPSAYAYGDEEDVSSPVTTKKSCKNGKVWDAGKKRCVKQSS